MERAVVFGEPGGQCDGEDTGEPRQDRASEEGEEVMPLVIGSWNTQSGSPTTAPGNGKYNADNWASPTVLAISATDVDGTTHDAAQINPGDTLYELANNNAQNYLGMKVNSVVNNVTWFQVSVSVTETGSAFVTPGMNQQRLLELVRGIGTGPVNGTKVMAVIPGGGWTVVLSDSSWRVVAGFGVRQSDNVIVPLVVADDNVTIVQASDIDPDYRLTRPNMGSGLWPILRAIS
jgi:NADH:ubiquinone oxidoreductase subunit F (NADH-binding)